MIEIPFLPEFKDALASGRKIATTRSRRYVKEGEFTAFGMTFLLVTCYKKRLYHVACVDYKEEGLDSPEAFIGVWNRTHKRKKYEDDPNLLVWLHLFRRIA